MNDIILGNRFLYEPGSERLSYETCLYAETLTKTEIENANIIEYTS